MIRPTAEQLFIVNEAVKWYYNSNEQVFQYDGGPGVGKSFVLDLIIRALMLDPVNEVAAMSYTGSASLVMRIKGLYSAKTAHSWIYNPVVSDLTDKDGNVVIDELTHKPVRTVKFKPIERLPSNIKLVVVDEGYSMPLKMKPDILKFGIKVLVCGDQNQLPPVGDEPAFLNDGNIYHLTQCMRQLGREDISYISSLVSNGIRPMNGYYGNTLVIDKKDLTMDMLLWADAVICGKNKTRDIINARIREALGFKSLLPQQGEKVVCRSNNWEDCIYLDDGYAISPVNGLICTVLSNPDVSSMAHGQFLMTCRSNIIPEAIFVNLKCNYKHMTSDHVIRNAIRQDRYSKGNMFEFAYAITAHIAQGSQFHRVVYLEEYMPKDIQSRLNLVGSSRADTSLIYVKP